MRNTGKRRQPKDKSTHTHTHTHTHQDARACTRTHAQQTRVFNSPMAPTRNEARSTRKSTLRIVSVVVVVVVGGGGGSDRVCLD